jgi:flavin reductase (DIM6/NTAB) family NADH-FMN oxidoreductase RutF
MSVHLKLMQSRVDLQAEKLSKSGKNKFAGYSYFELVTSCPRFKTSFSALACAVTYPLAKNWPR